MKNETLGRMVCPECGASGAAIKMDKSGRLYRWCMDGCGAKFHARDEDQEYMMSKHLFKDHGHAEKQAEKTAEKQAEKTAEKPAEKTAEKPAGSPAERFTLGGLR